MRAKLDLQIVARAVVEVDFVANVETQSDMPEISFNSASGIQHAEGSVGPKGSNLSCEAGVSTSEVQKPAFGRHEELERAAGLELRSEQTVPQVQAAAHDILVTGYIARTRQAGRETLIQVVSHLAFKLNVGTDIETYASANSIKIGVHRCQSCVVGEYTCLTMILALGKR